MYRAMYVWVLKKRSIGNKSYLYDLNPRRFENEVESEFEIMKSITLRCFYGIPTIITICIMLCKIIPMGASLIALLVSQN